MEKLFQGDPWKVRQNKIRDAIFDIYGKEFFRGKSVLTLGCGYADIELPLADLGADLICSDARQEYLDYIKKYNDVTVIKADLDNEWPFENKFDLILCIGVLYHLKEPDKVLAHICTQCDNLFLETEYLDTKNRHIMTCLVGEMENKSNHNVNQVGCRPSHGMVERVLNESGMQFKRIKNGKYNSQYHIYDMDVLETFRADSKHFRGIWVCTRKQERNT